MVFDILDRQLVQYEIAGENIAMNNYAHFGATDRPVAGWTSADLYDSAPTRLTCSSRPTVISALARAPLATA